jgi:dCTP deaminase
MSVLSNQQIFDARDRGHVVIEPYVEANVRKSSVDLTLGEWFYRGSIEEGGIYNPFDEADVERNYVGPFQAKPYLNVWRKLLETGKGYAVNGWPYPKGFSPLDPRSPIDESKRTGDDLVNIPANHPLIMLLPGEFILAHTHEFIGIHPPGTTEMRARSTWGRSRISACLCAGWGDPGYINRWTMEIHNFGPKAVPLPIGERIAQMIFHETGPVAGGTYGNETTYDSKYQGSSEIAEVMAQWKPTALLPRSYKDERVLPTPLD